VARLLDSKIIHSVCLAGTNMTSASAKAIIQATVSKFLRHEFSLFNLT